MTEPETEAGLRRVGQIVVDDRPHCPTCGHLVSVQGTPEGTRWYEPDERDVEAEARAPLEARIMGLEEEADEAAQRCCDDSCHNGSCIPNGCDHTCHGPRFHALYAPVRPDEREARIATLEDALRRLAEANHNSKHRGDIFDGGPWADEECTICIPLYALLSDAAPARPEHAPPLDLDRLREAMRRCSRWHWPEAEHVAREYAAIGATQPASRALASFIGAAPDLTGGLSDDDAIAAMRPQPDPEREAARDAVIEAARPALASAERLLPRADHQPTVEAWRRLSLALDALDRLEGGE